MFGLENVRENTRKRQHKGQMEENKKQEKIKIDLKLINYFYMSF